MKLGLKGRVMLASTASVLTATLAISVLAGWAVADWPGMAPQAHHQLLLRLTVASVAVTAAVLAVLWAALHRGLVRPVAQMVRALDSVRRGEPGAEVQVQVGGGPELRSLGEGIHHLAQALAQRERELLSVQSAVEQASRAKSQFLAVMSHELRTPLNAVLGMAELLHSSRLDARQERFVAQIRHSGRALVDIIGDVLDLARLETGQLKLLDQPFRLRDAVLDTVELFRESAQARGLELSVHVDASLPDVVRGDVVHLQQILTNLLSNAIKFTEQGDVVVRVTPCDAGLRFSVSDTGVGIASDFLPHIYEAFRQGDSSPTRRFGGAGLGLSIARRLCVAMGGRIDASSRPGKGSTFWFELPLPAVPGGLPAAS
jgi:signal transduction histidine kinase